MDRKMLRDDQWARIEQLLPGKASDPGCTAKNNRLLVEAILWILRTGSPWRDLPQEFGKWHSTYMRFARWRDSGVWERVADVLCSDADMEHLFIDSTPLSVPTSILPAPKKSRQSGNRPLARRTDDQAACSRRRAGQSAARHPLGRTDRRYRPCLGIDREFAGSGRGGRQGLRRRPFRNQDQGHWCRGCDSAPIQSPHAARLRSASLPALAI